MVEDGEEAYNGREDLIKERDQVYGNTPNPQGPTCRRERLAEKSPPQYTSDGYRVSTTDGSVHQANDAVKNFCATQIEKSKSNANEQRCDLTRG